MVEEKGSSLVKRTTTLTRIDFVALFRGGGSVRRRRLNATISSHNKVWTLGGSDNAESRREEPKHSKKMRKGQAEGEKGSYKSPSRIDRRRQKGKGRRLVDRNF